MKKIAMIVQVVLGLMLLFFGINKFMGFMNPPPMAEPAQAFMQALMDTGYIMPIVGVLQVLAGISFLINKYAKFFLVFFAPITFNILFFHLFLDMKGILMALLVVIMHFFLFWAYRKSYYSLFS